MEASSRENLIEDAMSEVPVVDFFTGRRTKEIFQGIVAEVFLLLAI